MQDNKNKIQKQQDFIDKLTGNAKYQGNFGEKFLEQSLQIHGFKENIDYTKQKKNKFIIWTMIILGQVILTFTLT